MELKVLNKDMPELLRKVNELGISPRDIDESFIRSSGPGGQNVNKVSTCVCLVHRPTNTVVKSQKFRTQSQNRLWAWNRLIEKIEFDKKTAEQTQVHQTQKLYRKNRKRPKGVKEKILDSKRTHSQKKIARRPIKILQQLES